MSEGCAHCGGPVPASTRAPRRYCTQKCRNAASWKRRVERDPEHWRGRRYPSREKPCSTGCGALVQTNPSKPAKSAPTCRKCRAANPKSKSVKTPCVDCEAPAWGERCRPCRDAVVQREADPVAALRRKRQHKRRDRRDKATPGLTKTARHKLLHLWRRQGKVCVYCGAAVQCVDHVVPLALGGTNYEGNLAPACTDCNLRKSDNLIIEWRAKRRMSERQYVEPPPLLPRPTPKRKVWTDVPFKTCEQCSALYLGTRRRYCCEECMWQANRTRSRNRYRIRVGIPLETPPWQRAA